MEQLTCKIDGIVFSNRNTGFVVARVIPDGRRDLVTVRGTFPGIPVGVGLKACFTGEFQDDPKYGRQLVASGCDIIPEPGRSGIVTYLSTHVPSIGPITAARMYDALGDGLIDILDTSPEQIRELKFLTKPQADAVIAEWKVSSDTRTASVFLSELGLNSSQIRSVYTKFGASTKDAVLTDPYRLYECAGVGFSTADAAARKIGVGRDDPRRLKAIVRFIMSDLASSEGHMYTTSSNIQDHARKVFRRHSLDPFSHGDYLVDTDLFRCLSDMEKSGEVSYSGSRVYLTSNWVHEKGAADALALMLVEPPHPFKDLQETLNGFEKSRGLTLSDDQRNSFMLLAKSRVCVISGFPGTGKTTLISAFVHLFEMESLNYVLMSPTGIAAKRISQATGKPASTIHRALGLDQDGSWEFHAGNKFVVDAVIVDEMSMVDASIFHHLITSIKPNTIFILVGDRDQLPSVGPGHVLNNLMTCESIPHVALTRIYRQGAGSGIVTAARSILSGQPVDTSFNRSSEFVFLTFPYGDVADEVCKAAIAMKAKNLNFQVIAPVYDGDLGVDQLNAKLRFVLNPEFSSGKSTKLPFKGRDRSGSDIHEGDRVMIIRNDYGRMIFNGDVGKITRVSLKNDEVDVKIFEWFDRDASPARYVDKIFTLRLEEARSLLRVAFACTAHKVQGQEFDFVLMPMTMKYGIMLYRHLIYTAITRARKKVFLFGDPQAFHHAVMNLRETNRNSALGELVDAAVRRGAEAGPQMNAVHAASAA